MQKHKFVVIGFICLTICSSCLAQQTNVPQKTQDVEKVVLSIEQNSRSIAEFSMRSVSVTSTSPHFWGEMSKKPLDLISGNHLEVISSFGLVSGRNIYLARKNTKLSPTIKLVDKTRFWNSESIGKSYQAIDVNQFLTSDSKVGVANGGNSVYYERNSDQIIPFTDLERIQHLESTEKQDYLREIMPDISVAGRQIYQGLECIKLQWKGGNVNSSFEGYCLVCPSRNYRQLYNESNIKYSQSALPRIERHDIMNVEKLTLYTNTWIPSQVYSSTTFKNIDGTEDSLIEKFRVVEFNANDLTIGLLFQPLFPPGAKLYQNGFIGAGGKLSIIGGDTSALEDTLQKGDISILKKENNNLSSP